MNYSLDTLSSNVSMVINYPSKYDFTHIDTLLSHLDTIGYFYYFINHNKDFDENNKPKTYHSHLVLQSPKRHQLKFFIRLLATCLEIPNMLISIEPCESLALSIQYLIHKNHPLKAQYLMSDISTNISLDMLESYLNQTPQSVVDFTFLCKLIDESLGNRLYIIRHIGLKQYNDLRNTINDIIREKLARGSDFMDYVNDKDLPF